MKKYFFLLVFWVKAFAASSLFHVVIAEKWLEIFEDYSEDQRKSFLLGTIFPDIRYLAGLSRQATHERGLTLDQIKTIEDPFIKGMKLHSFVDETRDRYVRKNGILQRLENIPADKVLLLKMIEDDLLYSMGQKNTCDELCVCLETIENQERQFGIPEKIIQDWHQQHIGYFSLGPRRFYAQILGNGGSYGAMPVSIVRLSIPVFETFENDAVMRKYLLDILAEFEHLFTKEENK